MRCPSCGYSDEPLRCAISGKEIQHGDVYDVLPSGRIELVAEREARDAKAAEDAAELAGRVAAQPAGA